MFSKKKKIGGHTRFIDCDSYQEICGFLITSVASLYLCHVSAVLDKTMFLSKNHERQKLAREKLQPRRFKINGAG